MIKRYFSNADTTITNAYDYTLSTSGSDSNMGASDILETFHMYANVGTASAEDARILIKFDDSQISTQRTAGTIPASGSVSFYLRLFNAEHQESVPDNFTLEVRPLSQSFEEGYGLDMENYTDKSYLGAFGATWNYAASGTAWTAAGGDFSGSTSTQYFSGGVEDLEVDITHFVEEWLAGDSTNYGFAIKLTSTEEDAERSYYTKRFFGKGSEFFFKRPVIEARWDSSVIDYRSSFLVSSSAVSAADNLNTIFFYNYVRGTLKDLPNLGEGSQIYVNLYNSASEGTLLSPAPNTPVTGGWYDTGTYTASVALYTTESVVYDRWFSGSTTYYTGTINIGGDNLTSRPNASGYTSCMVGMKPVYKTQETVRFFTFIREKNWSPNLYSVANGNSLHHLVENSFYKVTREKDNEIVVDYGTGSTLHTKMSANDSYNYFDFDMSLLEKGFSYRINLMYNIDGKYVEQPQSFKFRVE